MAENEISDYFVVHGLDHSICCRYDRIKICTIHKYSGLYSIHILWDHINTSLILIMAGFMYNKNMCDSYLKDEAYVNELFESIKPNCGCIDPYPPCRYINIDPIHNPISWVLRISCKKNATAACKSSVKDITKIWMKVPPKDDKVCFNAYKETEMWASSCK